MSQDLSSRQFDQPEHYVVNRSIYPPSCFPAWMDTDDFIDITRIGDSWRRYFDPVTRTEHDCAEYWARHMEDV